MEYGMDEFELYPELIQIAGTDGAQEIPLVVPIGEAWKLTQVIGLHNDPAARDCYWDITDGVTRYRLKTPINLATNILDFLYKDTYINGPLIVFHNFEILWNVTAVAAGFHGVIRATVYKLRGLPVRE
ncbi:unnamed protein product [marine sediment metagenome]|uniref:Uncharacterized protein n=1 Tax=marine sediment metagenome TaxID=412755 RepID=X1MQQ5_9ZZZZ